MKSSLELNIIHDMATIDRPLFRNVTAEALVRARHDEGAFEDFRAALTEVFLAADALPDDPAFPEQRADAVKQLLGAKVRDVERATAGSAILRAGAEAAESQLILGSAIAVGGAVFGAPVAPLLGGAGGASIVDCIRRMLFRPKLKGANLVISALLPR